MISLVSCIISGLSFGKYLFESGNLTKNYIEISHEDSFFLKIKSISGGTKN